MESGLPEWAIFAPSFGLPYRRWMRRAAKAAWLALGVVSLLAGFWDLYRNLPGARHALGALYRVSGVPEARGMEAPRKRPCAVSALMFFDR